MLSTNQEIEEEDFMMDEFVCTENLKYHYNTVTEEQWQAMENITCAEKECIVDSWLQPLPEGDGESYL